MTKDHLIRALGLSALIIYCVGDILGAGIYAIVGKIAGYAGSYAWLSFAVAMAMIYFTALCYAELGSRIPKSGGVSIYVNEAFGRKGFSLFVGLLLFCATVLSMSTLSQAFVGYITALGFHVAKWIAIFGFFFILLLINIRGIKESSIANILSTAVEVSGLIIVLICGGFYLLKSNHAITAHQDTFPSIKAIFQGAALAFFAFTGFEDLANVAEEVKQPEKTLPRALLSALGIAGILYLSVSWMATAIIPGTQLNTSHAPLLDVVAKSYPPMPNFVFSVIALFAIFNTTLLNYITASRLLYGMSASQLMPKFLQKIHHQYHTPYMAILLIFPIVLVLGIIGTLGGLAASTSAVVLTVFSCSCIALIKIKSRNIKISEKIFQIPRFVPWLAVVLNIIGLLFLPLHNLLIASIFIGVIMIVSWIADQWF